MLVGEANVHAMEYVKKQGFVPDVIFGHANWGSMMYCKDFYPNVPVIGCFEWFYHAEHSSWHYWEGEEASLDERMATRSANMHNLASLNACDVLVTPTQWQLQQFPEVYRKKFHVLHEGINTDLCAPYPDGGRPALRLSTGFSLPQGTAYISYVSRGLEPMRGFDKFMDAVRIVLKKWPELHVVIVGEDKPYYAAPDKSNKTYAWIRWLRSYTARYIKEPCIILEHSFIDLHINFRYKIILDKTVDCDYYIGVPTHIIEAIYI